MRPTNEEARLRAHGERATSTIDRHKNTTAPHARKQVTGEELAYEFARALIWAAHLSWPPQQLERPYQRPLLLRSWAVPVRGGCKA